MDRDRKSLIVHTVTRLPQWIRHDLSSKDIAIRSRAEETLAAVIVNALKKGTGDMIHG